MAGRNGRLEALLVWELRLWYRGRRVKQSKRPLWLTSPRSLHTGSFMGLGAGHDPTSELDTNPWHRGVRRHEHLCYMEGGKRFTPVSVTHIHLLSGKVLGTGPLVRMVYVSRSRGSRPNTWVSSDVPNWDRNFSVPWRQTVFSSGDEALSHTIVIHFSIIGTYTHRKTTMYLGRSSIRSTLRFLVKSQVTGILYYNLMRGECFISFS